MPDQPLVVMAAPNGARLSKAGHPAVPLTSEEIADCAAELSAVGVSVLHLHVRDAKGGHVLDAERYIAVIDAIRERTGDRLVIQVTTEAMGRYDRGQQMALLRGLRPEAASLALRELCPDAAAEPEAGEFFHELIETGTWPQYILYTPAEAARFERLRQAGFFGTYSPFVLFVLGRYSDSMQGNPDELDALLATFEAGSFPWAVCCFGPTEAEAVMRAARLGGHVRIGFENNRTLPDGTQAGDNAQLVVAELQLVEQSGVSNRPLASADWVRRQLAGRT